MKKNKKIGIVTLHGYFNYGNRLQNYALKHVIESLGFEVDTTVITDKKMNYKTKFNKVLKLTPSEVIKKITNQINKRTSQLESENEIQNNRMKIFKEFSIEHLNEKFYDVSNKDAKEIEEYSYFVTGSDQVWNPFYYDVLPIYFLTFTKKYKRIAYAPSISRDELSGEHKEDYTNWLNGISELSVREDAGSKIIKELTGINAPVLADPAMLLTKEEWLTISKRAQNRPDTPYLLTYFLGGPSKETKAKLEKIAAEKNMTIINLGDIQEVSTYETGPGEFIDYINHASAFFTDSFHGVIFSILLDTPFIVYKRESSIPSMYSRIETLLDKFDLRNREVAGFNEDVFSMNLDGSEEIIAKEYKKSIDFLKNAFNISD